MLAGAQAPGRSHTKCSPWSSRLGVGRGDTTPPRKNVLLRNHGGGQDTQGCSARKEDEDMYPRSHIYYYTCILGSGSNTGLRYKLFCLFQC
jgi:hypothetical protein